jgi:uncharacterized membrane protein YbhN (UPF0104 family)
LKKRIINGLKIVLFFGVGFTILYFVYQNYNANWQAQCAIDGIPPEDCNLIQKIVNDFRTANFFWLFMVVFLFAISNLSRTYRWLMLIHPLGFRPHPVTGFFSIMLMYLANLGLPRVGEFVRAASLSNTERIPVEKVMGTVVVDRIADLISMVLVMGLAFILQFNEIWDFIQQYLPEESDAGGGWSSNTKLFVFLAGGLVLGASLLFIFRRPLMKTRLYGRLKEMIQGFWQGMNTIRQLEKPGWFIFHSVNIWLMYYLMVYVGFFSFGPTAHLGPLAALLVYVVGALGIVIPSPGGMGTYHFLVSAVLTSFYSIPEADAFSFANIMFFVVQLGGNVFLGVIALFVLPYMRRRNMVQEEALS